MTTVHFRHGAVVMHNLNDYYYFVQVVKYQGFTNVSETLGITKSKLSRRISELEARLGVRLIQRNTRKFVVTEIGQQFYEYCLKILEDVNQAENFIHSTISNEPSGLIRISCPVPLVNMPVGVMIADFMQLYPNVQIQLLASNRRVDLIEEGIDLALCARSVPIEDSELVVRELDAWELVLVAAPQLFKDYPHPQKLEDLIKLPSIGFDSPKPIWMMQKRGENNIFHDIEYCPKLRTDNFFAIKAAVLKGVGIASLPKVYVNEALSQGTLVEVMPDWHLPKGVIYVVYTSRLGMLPAVRTLLDYLVEQFKQLDIHQTQQYEINKG